MLQLDKIESLCKKRKRRGRGGDKGGTSGRGHKGQRARTSGKSDMKPWFEGGQMSLTRRLPRRGFTNVFKKEFSIVNLRDLENNFSSGDIVNQEILFDKGLVKGNKRNFLIKILGKGTLTKKLNVSAQAFSESAIKAIEGCGGKAELIKEV
jgi:large subunit ribosomal protein L15